MLDPPADITNQSQNSVNATEFNYSSQSHLNSHFQEIIVGLEDETVSQVCQDKKQTTNKTKKHPPIICCYASGKRVRDGGGKEGDR